MYGRLVGFSFLHVRLMSLWKLVGKIDCVGLGKEFFLVQFLVKEDYEAVLRNGPWFTGGNFLSIRPWEPDFKPSEANISSVVDWVRLNELPIEYYDVEALQIIGNTICRVLRIDTHTANESRGRFARLCIQVDNKKPLSTTILIRENSNLLAMKESKDSVSLVEGWVTDGKAACMSSQRTSRG